MKNLTFLSNLLRKLSAKTLVQFSAVFTLLCTLGTTNVWGTTFTTTSGGGFSNGSKTIDGITVAFGGSVSWQSGHVRVYQSNTISFSCSSNITEIVMNCSSGARDFNASTGECSTTGSAITWTGSATNITLTLPSGSQVRITSIVVTTGSSCSTPPTVGASGNSSISVTGATVSCTGITKGDCDIDEWGFFYKTGSSGVTTSDTKVQVSAAKSTTNVSSFNKSFTELNPNTHYYFKAYAKVGSNYYLSSETDFTTKTLTSTSSNTTYGTVSRSGRVITGSLKSGGAYGSPAYTVTGASDGSTTTVERAGNTFTVTSNSTSNITVRINFEAKGCEDHGASSITGGTSTGTTYGPVSNYYNYGARQILYTKEDLGLAAGKKGTIKSIYFEYAYTSAITKKDKIKIYMANTTLETLSTSSYVPYASFTEVYSGDMNFTVNGWNEISITNFEYDGVGNLAVLITDNSGKYDGSSYVFKYKDAPFSGAQIYKNLDGSFPDPSSDGTWADNATASRPNTKFCIQESDMPTYTVNFYVNGSTARTQTGYAGTTLTSIPTPVSGDCDGSKVFVGWYTNTYSHATNAPAFVTPTTIPVGGANYYAVFATGTTNYKIATKTDLLEGTKVVLVNGTNAVASTAGTTDKLDPVSISSKLSEGVIANPGSDIIWTVALDGTKYKFKQSSNYLNAVSNSTKAGKLYCNATSDSWSINTSSTNYYLESTNATNRKLEYYDSKFTAYNGDLGSAYWINFYTQVFTNYETNCCTQLGSVSATNSAKTGTTADFTWSAVAGAESYKVKVPGSSSHNDWTTATSGVSVTGLTAGNSYTAYFKAFDSNGTHCAEGPESTIEFTTPKITLGSASGTSTYNEGSGPGSKQTFTVTAVGLTGNLTVTAPTNFAVCATESGSYTSSITLTPTSGAVSTTVYFQLVAEKTAAASPYAGNVTVSGGSATEQTVAVNGTVNQACADPTITVQPAASASYNLNVSAAALSVTATKNGTGPALTYQWYSNTANSKTTPTPSPIDGATSSSYTPLTTATGTKYYFCEVSSGACAVTSNISAITVNTPSITVSETSIAFGDKAKDGSHTATFTVSGTNLASSTGLTLAITGSSYFTIDQSSVAQTSAGTVSTTTITVTYAPTVIGDGYSATITISSTGAENKTVTLSGNSKYQITWVDEAASPAATTYTYVASGKPTFPSNPTGGCDTYTYFYGWAEGTFTTPVTAPGTSSAIKVYKSASEMPNVSGNVTYYAVWSNAAPADYSTTYTSNVTLPTSGTNAYSANVTISGNNYSGAKIGKSGGAGSSSFTVPSGTKKIFLHTVNWYNEDNTLTLSSGTLGVTISPSDAITPPRNSGMEGSDNDFTLATLDGTQYKEYTLTGVSSTATINVSSTSRLLVWGINATSSTGEGNCVTSCCEEVAARSGSVSTESTSATVSWTVTGTAASKISSWDVSCKVTSSGAAAGTKGSITTVGTTKSITFTGLNSHTGYTFHILGTSNDDAYCDVDDELTGTTECLTPALSVTGTWGLCAGEELSLSLTSTSNIDPSATYQWQKYIDSDWENIPGATNSTYTVASCTKANAGSYQCIVTNPGTGSCSATSNPFGVKVYTVYIDDGNNSNWQHIDLTNDGTSKGKVTITLDADKTYHFKIYDNNNVWYGQTGTDNIPDATTWILNGSNNVNLATRLSGGYLFEVNYASTPTVKVTFPEDDQVASKKIWFDNSIRNWSTMYYRVGNTGTNKNSTSFTLVPGTDKFYVVNTLEQSDVAAWHIANNASWSGDGNSIYMVNGSGFAITEATAFQKYLVGSDGVTLVPVTPSTGTSSGCAWYDVTKTDGMLTHTATITTPSHGTIHLAYTDVSSTAQDKTGTTAGLAHRTKITASATPDAGYELTSFTVTPDGESAQNLTSGVTDNHILAKDATFAATFGAKTITITWDKNGGSSVSPATSDYTYDGSTVALATATHATKLFAGWYTDPSAGTQITEIGTTNKPTDDVTYYAHWVDGNTVYFNAGGGSMNVGDESRTQTSIGGSVTLPTPNNPVCASGWTFQGWKVGSAQTDVTALPDGLLAGGSSYVPESATVQMYAVYKKTVEESSVETAKIDWEAPSGYMTGWSEAGGDSWNRTSTEACNGSYSGFVDASAYLKYNTKVKVKSVSANFLRTTNSDKGAFMFEKSTDGSNWSDVDADNWITVGSTTKNTWYPFSYTQAGGFFDGSTEYYIRLSFTTDGTANRYFDDITITYNDVTSVTHYVTSPTECSQVATPVITPEGDSYTGSRDITITCATAGSTIRYTTDGTDPSSSVGTVIASGSSFTLSCSGTVKAIAYKDGMSDSEIASETYTITAPNPTFSPDGGDFNVAQSVSISDALAGTTVYYEYTTDGSEPSDPTSSSTAYSSTPISVAVGQTVRVKAIAISDCATSSAIVSKTFRVGWDFELVTNEDDLNVGDKIVILNGTTNALSTYGEGGNNRTSTSDFDLDGTTVTAYPKKTINGTTVQVITLAGSAGAWKLMTSDTKWFNCPSAGKLTTVTTDGSGAEDLARRRWSIDIGSSPNYYATIQNNQETTATIQYGTVFAAYATDQYPVKIYSLPNPDPLIRVEGTLSAFTGCTSEASAAQSFYVSGKNLSASILVTAPTGYEVSLSSGSGYAGSIEVERVGTAVSKTQVYVRLKAGSAGAVAANNVVVSVEANSLSQNVAIPASTIAAADTYIDRMHGNSTSYECGSYSAPDLEDGDMVSGTDCQKNYAIFRGWVAADQINLDGTLKAGATVISEGSEMTASGTTYYSVWEAIVE